MVGWTEHVRRRGDVLSTADPLAVILLILDTHLQMHIVRHNKYPTNVAWNPSFYPVSALQIFPFRQFRLTIGTPERYVLVIPGRRSCCFEINVRWSHQAVYPAAENDKKFENDDSSPYRLQNIKAEQSGISECWLWADSTTH